MPDRPRSFTFYAIATLQSDGRWYPWLQTMSSKREGAMENYEKFHGKLKQRKDVAVKRFFVGTEARNA